MPAAPIKNTRIQVFDRVQTLAGKTADGSSIVLGVITGHHGVRGWIRVKSHTRPAEQIFDYSRWRIHRSGSPVAEDIKVTAFRRSSRKLLAKLEGYDDRDGCEHIIGCEVAVDRSQLEDPGSGRYYWFDLIGLRVIDRDNRALGKITDMMETGANDVAVITSEKKAELLLPWIPRVIEQVDLSLGVVKVDWDESE